MEIYNNIYNMNNKIMFFLKNIIYLLIIIG